VLCDLSGENILHVKMIICLGTTPAVGRTMTFERVSVDAVNRAKTVQADAAGKAINAARVLHTLGRDPVATGFLGGFSGQLIQQDLDRIGMAHDFLIVEPPTRVCVTVIDQSAGTATELIEEAGAVPADAYSALLAKLEDKIKQAKGLILAGGLPAGAPRDFYARCVSLAVSAGVFVVLDAKGEPLRQSLGSRPTIVKPNRSELEETVGMKIDSDETLKEAIRQLIAAGPRWAVVTAGAAATVASDGKSFWRISTPKVQTISAIGSGDSFAGGLMAGVTEGKAVPEACRLGAACGAANAMTPFAGHVRLQDVEALLSQIVITPF
jgi:tagatose 6-phosphate kinase